MEYCEYLLHSLHMLQRTKKNFITYTFKHEACNNIVHTCNFPRQSKITSLSLTFLHAHHVQINSTVLHS